jgi:hypothetical protein
VVEIVRICLSVGRIALAGPLGGRGKWPLTNVISTRRSIWSGMHPLATLAASLGDEGTAVREVNDEPSTKKYSQGLASAGTRDAELLRQSAELELKSGWEPAVADERSEERCDLLGHRSPHMVGDGGTIRLAPSLAASG